MSVTERLYYQDSHLMEFEGRVTSVTERVSGWASVTLDRTAFYPAGGGQPGDTGTLDGARVVECIDAEEEGVIHVIRGRLPAIGSVVKGRVNWERRLDHIQQHTGQHILSQAFVKLFEAETRGFRMMEQASEIDVALADPSDEHIERAVELSNRIIWEDHPVHVRTVSAQEAARLPLRKESTREGDLRLIEIEGFDLTPCGGTHAVRTGEVGLLAVRSWERAKGMTRIEFVAGTRALADYRRANHAVREIAGQFSVGRDEAIAAVARLHEEHKHLLRRVRALEEIAARVEAQEVYAAATPSEDGTRIITHAFDGRDAESLKRLALALIAHGQTVALLGARDADGTARLVFARSADAAGDMNDLMRAACALLEGRGGGRPDMAQGGGHNALKLTEALTAAAGNL